MKNSEIIKLFNKGIHCEKIKMSEEYGKLFDEKIKYEKELTEKLSPELLQLFKSYIDISDILIIKDTDEYFAYGFKHGVLLGIEIGSSD